MGSPLTIDDLYDLLDNNQLSSLIMRIMKEKDLLIKRRIAEDYEPDPLIYNHFIIIQGTELLLLRITVGYWYEAGVGQTYQIHNVIRYESRTDFEFHQIVHGYADMEDLPEYKLN